MPTRTRHNIIISGELAMIVSLALQLNVAILQRVYAMNEEAPDHDEISTVLSAIDRQDDRSEQQTKKEQRRSKPPLPHPVPFPEAA